MTASTTPVTPVQLYALTDDTKHGIPKTLDELGIATKQEVSAAAAAAETHLADGENTTVTGSGAIGDPVTVNTPTVTLKIVSGKYVLTNEAGTQVTIDPSVFVAAASPNGIKVAPDGRLYVPGASDATPGIVTLAVASNYPSASDEETATPAYVAAALDDAGNLVAGTNTTVTGAGTTADPFKVNTPAVQLTVDGANYKLTNESGVAIVIQPGQFVSSVAGNAITTAPDGRLVVQIPAQLPDNQVFSGDNSGTVNLVLTPTTTNAGTPDEQTNYTIKADLRIAATNPDGSANRLKWGPSGFWVEIKDVFCE